MAFALINTHDNTVVDVKSQEHPVHSSLMWVDAGVSLVQAGWLYSPVTGAFSKVYPPLDEVRPQRIEYLRWQCRFAITGGFTSDALGAPHTYGSTDTAQSNLAHDVEDSRGADATWAAPIACATDAEIKNLVWPVVEHTAEQVQKVMLDFRAHRVAMQDKLRKTLADVEAASTSEAVLDLEW